MIRVAALKCPKGHLRTTTLYDPASGATAAEAEAALRASHLLGSGGHCRDCGAAETIFSDELTRHTSLLEAIKEQDKQVSERITATLLAKLIESKKVRPPRLAEGFCQNGHALAGFIYPEGIFESSAETLRRELISGLKGQCPICPAGTALDPRVIDCGDDPRIPELLEYAANSAAGQNVLDPEPEPEPFTAMKRPRHTHTRH